MVCYPDPTNSLAIAKLIFRNQVTLFCGTSTCLSLYARNKNIHPLMLSSLKIIISGAEKLSPNVYKEFKEKFNLDIYEGYGATEVAPVASCNLPDVLSPADWQIHIAHKSGTVGLPLPGCAFRIVDPVTLIDLPIEEEGLVLIGGTQVMRGYLNNPEKTSEVLIQDNDLTWYKTGDKGKLDKDGYLILLDRYSRFAKIGGEMVALGQLEEQIQQLLGETEAQIMIMSLSDTKKGEKLAMLYQGSLSKAELVNRLNTSSLPRLKIPKKIVFIDALPMLGTGKRDYPAAKKLFDVDQ